jgi:predicted PhzF superfamily epimerase YddE/YHI9
VWYTGGMQRFVVVDAFTERAFAGNPAAVVVLEGPADEGWMKAVAREMNLAETAFLFPEAEGWRLRWLTPTVEIELCGHATLASAHVLWESGRADGDEPLRFFTLSGELGAGRRGSRIVLDFPARPMAACPPPPGLEAALGAPARWVGRRERDYLVELESAKVVRELQPDLGALERLARTVIVTAAGDEAGIDFVSRFFAPGVGVPEDPVTGSAHCALGPFWGERLGRTELTGYQASARGGTVYLTLRGDRLDLGGHAVTVSRGEILGPRSA